MSSRRSRHSPTSRTSYHPSRGTKEDTPRHLPMVPIEHVDNAFDDVTLDNFSLSYSGSTTSYDVSTWLSSAPLHPPEDDYPFSATSLSAQDTVSTDGSLPYRSMMSPSSGVEMSNSYAALPSSYSRHAPLEDQLACATKQLSSGPIDPISMHVTSLPLEPGNFPTSFNDISQAYTSSFGQPDSWGFGIPSPPLTHSSSNCDDSRYTGEFSLPSAMASMSPFPNRHSPSNAVRQEVSVCEPMGPSRIQPYCGPNTVVSRPPRPLRCASDRKESEMDSRQQEPSHSPEENNKPREHPLYERGPDEKGFYRCPYIEEDGCQHPPTKQKCIYAKYLDSHLKPYRCRVPKPECQEKVFSSNACLFRHEREAHGFHGHGENPNLCWFTSCDRAKPGNGFPRKWNLGDHMKRVHNINMSDFDGQGSGANERHSNIQNSRKRKGSSGLVSVPMKRSGSSYTKAHVVSAPYSKDGRHSVTTSRHAAQVKYSTPIPVDRSCNYQDSYSIPAENVQYSSMAYYSPPSRHAPIYPGSTYAQVPHSY